VAKVKAEAEARNEERALNKARVDLIRHINAYANLKEDKVCAYCGTVFHNEYPSAKYCSDKCRRKAHDKRRIKAKPRAGSIRKRCRKYGVYYDPSVTSAKVFERDGYICQICGKPTDPSDTSWGIIGPNAPTVDHIVALKNGGTHTWGNVQCAHAICNSYKRDLWAEEFEEVLSCLA
jgi:5-methylcytosine-specific restriction endonuclease McrA